MAPDHLYLLEQWCQKISQKPLQILPNFRISQLGNLLLCTYLVLQDRLGIKQVLIHPRFEYPDQSALASQQYYCNLCPYFMYLKKHGISAEEAQTIELIDYLLQQATELAGQHMNYLVKEYGEHHLACIQEDMLLDLPIKLLSDLDILREDYPQYLTQPMIDEWYDKYTT